MSSSSPLVKEWADSVHFSTGTDNWATPDDLFAELDAEFGFTLDAAADATNHKVFRWLGPGSSIAEDALAVEDWGWPDSVPQTVWLNPPYSRPHQAQFIEHAAKQAQVYGHTVVCLLPSRTDTKIFHDLMWDRERHRPRPGVEVRFLKGRVRFKKADGGDILTSQRRKDRPEKNDAAPFPSMVVVFRP
jgi:phage N-6-adenine-methyltransferase